MKTSFYFVIWILIYPLLYLTGNSFITDNAFIVALAAVWGVSWLLNSTMPATMAYERAMSIGPTLEDVYTGNVASFSKRLSRDAAIETVTAVYLAVSTLVIALMIFKAGLKDLDNWIALVIFGLLAYSSISRSASLLGARSELKSEPTSEKCMEIAVGIYELDYAAYYEAHAGVTYQEMLPPRPRHFMAFKIFSIVTAAIATLLGLLLIVYAIIIMLYETSFDAGAFAGMNFLYGSLAAYFGVKDLISCIRTKTKSESKENAQSA